MHNNFQIEWIYQILIATLVGAAIGFERHSQSKEAGIRTHTFVCMGSALLVLVSKYGFMDTARFDSARVAAAIISGIGFLGAGVIFVRKDVIPRSDDSCRHLDNFSSWHVHRCAYVYNSHNRRSTDDTVSACIQIRKLQTYA